MKLPANQAATVRVSFTNANGNPAQVQGDVSWESSDPSIATVQVKPDDTLEATIMAGPSAGEAEIFATADADLGEGVREVESSLVVNVVARGEAVGGEIHPVVPGNALPGAPNRPDNSLPSGAHPDQGLPGAPNRPDNALPGDQPGIDHSLPGGPPNRPDNALPDTPSPKKG
jgi:hypothetical protein